MPQTFIYNPDQWFVSLIRSLEEYVVDSFNAEVSGNGDEIWRIIMDFPESDDLPEVVGESDKILVHFAPDNIENIKLGYGLDIVDFTTTPPSGPPPAPAGSVNESEAEPHLVNFDVGIWTYDNTGGATLRMETYQLLERFLHGPRAYQAVKDATEGVEVQSYNGGRWVTERIAGTRVFRMVDAELIVRVYSRKLTIAAAPLTDSIEQDPNLTIDGNPIP